MKAFASLKSVTRRDPSLLPARGTLLRRKCACGGNSGSESECEECKKQEVLQRRQAIGREPGGVPPVVHDVLRSPGQPLDRRARAFLEPRFGHDFSKVRVHTDARAAESAQAVNALAYTVGRHVVFGPGQYGWQTKVGRHLLAHELAHVVQQSAASTAAVPLTIGNACAPEERAADQVAERVLADAREPVSEHDCSPVSEGVSSTQNPGLSRSALGSVPKLLVQRAVISYRDLTWADFKGRAPAGTTFAAETSSGFTIPGWRPKEDVVDTKKDCTSGKTKTTEFTVTESIDPAVFDSLAATMTQERSWVQDRHKDDGKAWCAGQASDCEKLFNDQAAKARKSCTDAAANCQKAIRGGASSFSVTIGSDKITALSEPDCTSTFVKSCQESEAKTVSFDLQDDAGATFASARTKSACKKEMLDQCKAHEAAQSAYLLKHEQGHFDVSKVMADKTRASLKGKAATFSAREAGCGRIAAINAARKAFNALNAVDAMTDLGQKWIDSKNQAQQDYDDQTNHGLKKDKQAAWVASIASGLKTYDPTAPPLAAAPATPGPVTPAPAPNPPSPGP